ncbi:MAG: cbb3-type cytochrome oxidase assembly protein CcoS [Gammaproteobacteria bacterium]|nr:cbb3-type cytochrome oxidase assembly protein CcoS [Gammaproteobacteria bacterium]MBQ0838150.1 cbb3-type cytochrome oxidase assembly protein CcoS [Gammaproteobacteria bacterium]
MESLYFLIPLSIVVVALGIYLFFWAVNNGQYDDLDGEAERILFDELEPGAKTEADVNQQAQFGSPDKPVHKQSRQDND